MLVGKRVMSWYLEMTPHYRACFLKTRAFIMKGLQEEESPGWLWPGLGPGYGEGSWPGPTAQRRGNADLRAIGFHRFPPSIPEPQFLPLSWGECGGVGGLLCSVPCCLQQSATRCGEAVVDGTQAPVLLNPASLSAGCWSPLRRWMEFDVSVYICVCVGGGQFSLGALEEAHHKPSQRSLGSTAFAFYIERVQCLERIPSS